VLLKDKTHFFRQLTQITMTARIQIANDGPKVCGWHTFDILQDRFENENFGSTRV
jgi:hypothetical protein